MEGSPEHINIDELKNSIKAILRYVYKIEHSTLEFECDYCNE